MIHTFKPVDTVPTPQVHEVTTLFLTTQNIHLPLSLYFLQLSLSFRLSALDHLNDYKYPELLSNSQYNLQNKSSQRKTLKSQRIFIYTEFWDDKNPERSPAQPQSVGGSAPSLPCIVCSSSIGLPSFTKYSVMQNRSTPFLSFLPPP